MSKDVWISGGELIGLVNLSHFDQVIMNGRMNDGRMSTHWLQAQRLTSEFDKDGERQTIDLAISDVVYSESDNWDKYEALIAAMREAGVVVIDGALKAREIE